MKQQTDYSIISVDYGFTLDVSPTYETVINNGLAQQLVLFHHNKKIVLATDGNSYEAENYKKKLAEKGYPDLIDDVVARNTFNLKKAEKGYWQKFCEKFGVEPHQVVHIDDNADILAAAREAGIHAVNSKPKEKAAQNLVETINSITQAEPTSNNILASITSGSKFIPDDLDLD